MKGTIVVAAALCLLQVVAGHECKECKKRPMDISFVVDASSSVTQAGFSLGMAFMERVLNHFTISQTSVRVSLITFSGQAKLQAASDYQPGAIDEAHAIDFSQSVSNEAFISALSGVGYLNKDYTNTSAGIEYALDHQMSQARPDVKRVLVVITDGHSQDVAKTAAQGLRARSLGLAVFAVGVGPHVDQTELKNIAGESSRVFRATSYESLSDEIEEELTDGICIPPDEKEIKCRHLPLDLMFVIDTSSSINGDCSCDNWAVATQFIASVTDIVEIDDGTTRIAAVQYANGVRTAEAIPFGRFTTRASMKEALSNLQYVFDDEFGTATRTGDGIDFMRTQIMPDARGTATKVMVVVTDGISNYKGVKQTLGTKKTIQAADAARAAGATVISIGVGLAKHAQEDELVHIADSRSLMFHVGEFSKLQDIMQDLNKEICMAASQGQTHWHKRLEGVLKRLYDPRDN